MKYRLYIKHKTEIQTISVFEYTPVMKYMSIVKHIQFVQAKREFKYRKIMKDKAGIKLRVSV